MHIPDFTYRLLINAEEGTLHCEILEEGVRWWIKKARTPENASGIYLLETHDPEIEEIIKNSEYASIEDLQNHMIQMVIEDEERAKPITRTEGNVIYWLNP